MHILGSSVITQELVVGDEAERLTALFKHARQRGQSLTSFLLK
jgi:hypothetical protein